MGTEDPIQKKFQLSSNFIFVVFNKYIFFKHPVRVNYEVTLPCTGLVCNEPTNPDNIIMTTD